MYECVADVSSPDVSLTGAVCRARRSCRYGCCRVEAGPAAGWKETLPTLGEISSCVCLAAVSEDTGRSGRRALAGAVPSRCAFHLLLCLQSSLDVTETFKQQKTKLVREAFDPHVTQDPLYFLHAAQEDYVPLNASLYHSIVSGGVHL